MGAIYRREISSYFTSPIGYIFLAAFYSAAGLFFSMFSLHYGSTELNSVFANLMIICLVLIPILTMRVFSEDKRQKTDQCLLTAPLNLLGLVMGKFLAAFTIFSLGVAITIIYAVVVSSFAEPDWVVILGNILGLELLGAAFIAVGVFVSSLTENQVVSAVASFICMLVLYLIDAIATVIPVEFLSNMLAKLSINQRYYDFTVGILDLSHVLFFISIAGVFIFLTVRMIEKRRWN